MNSKMKLSIMVLIFKDVYIDQVFEMRQICIDDVING